ncbi:sugar transferase [Thetidibacter halocola]|uniref:sugar transferase n=1 Tax=Thetidibacter halocola TaxID=2827239 RepID=UPI00201337E4|nr:sugar transferase [Thetidibacter halocola]
MFDTAFLDSSSLPGVAKRLRARTDRGTLVFSIFKRSFDLIVAALLLPVIGLVALLLLILNPLYNPGTLFYVQKRMGRSCNPFPAIKFRSMREIDTIQRNANDSLERDRITPLGGFMRKTRIDELPQVLNVLKGDMSLIGPRPDYYDHAIHFLSEIPGYRERHVVRPGISGLAQTEVGYAVGVEATRRKVAADLYYISHSSVQLELWIAWRTLSVVVRGAGA